MKLKHDDRRLDFHPIGLAIKRAREARGMTQEELAYHQLLHGAELCHIYFKDRLRRHIVFTD